MAEPELGIKLPAPLFWIASKRHLIVPVSFLLLIVVLVIPMAPVVLDLLICLNISLAAIVLMTTIYMRRPLEFSVFPSLLLATTLFRLVLNVASTRLILSAEAQTPEDAQDVAGKVIETFANFVAGDSPIVGGIIFIILIVVQFVVITKGATRMSEVAARFTLDAMPGKQMAIDADLAAGLINEDEARSRRDQIMREADFYGAMDGASKFVRGDAIAGIIITMVNIIGGFGIALLEKGWTLSEGLHVFGLLAIGDGLVSQVPAFIVAIAAGLIVARAGGGKTISDEIPAQLASQPIGLYLISGFLLLLAVTPLPTIPLVTASLGVGGLAFFMTRQGKLRLQADKDRARQEAAQAGSSEPEPHDLLGVETLEIEVGYGLVQLVDATRGGDLLERIAMIRRQLASEIGIVVPPVRIRDNVQLSPQEYRVKIRGSVIGSGEVHPNLVMAMDSGVATGQLDGIPGVEPAFGLQATWIESNLRQRAETMNYTVVDPTSVVATHLAELIKRHADELLTREEVNALLDALRQKSPKLVDETIPAVVKTGELQKVLQALLRESVPIRDLETIIETLGDWAVHTKDPEVLVEYVRNALRRMICHQLAEQGDDGRMKLYCISLDPTLEELVSGYIDRSAAGTSVTMPPEMAAALAAAVSRHGQPLAVAGRQIILLTSPSVRGSVRKILETSMSQVVVLGYNEVIRELDVESVGLVQLPSEPTSHAAEPVVGAA